MDEVTVARMRAACETLRHASHGRLLACGHAADAPPPEMLSRALVVLMDEGTADGPDECPAKDWLLDWGRQLGAVWSIWAGTPDRAQVLAMVGMAMMHNAPLIVIVTEARYFRAWAEAIGPTSTRGLHMVTDDTPLTENAVVLNRPTLH